MIVKLKTDVDSENVRDLISWFEKKELEVVETRGDNSTVLSIIGDTRWINETSVKAFDCVDNVFRIQEAYREANLKYHKKPSTIKVKDVSIGSGNFVVIAGPCSVESREQVIEVAKKVKESGANILRGGAFKPRTSPYSFQGMGEKGIEYLLEAKEITGLPIVSEIMDIDDLPYFENVDMLQVGARNMQNFSLLKKLGKVDKPILLKRGLSATYEEWIMSAEYLMSWGNQNIVLCERGIRTFEKGVRNTLDITSVPYLRQRTQLPIIIDPSHACGDWEMVEPLSLAATAVGGDGLIVEVHNNPEKALCDGAQSLKPKKFDLMMKKISILKEALKEINELDNE
ncbi:MAG: 3-deoxy-7-phosphoheptulonate synthase [Lagierella massiliensis]|nr:3-deoxy-7-phosphoheptulonate synthase [Lagierella massiliensis]